MHLNFAPLLAASWLTDWHNWGVIAMVAIGLGMVIFVHELGHFLVAKACGVKCEKFYLGFDIFGLKLFRFRYGETEYGIGILPLGGYVKMLGQEDNPAKAAEERERAKLARDAAAGDVLPEGEAAAETSIFDPRSYLAMSVPRRMAIISAGVVMNVIFAFAVAVVAYRLGVSESPCVVGTVIPGDPAWQAGMRPGDDIVRIRDIENPRFRDLRSRVILGRNLDTGVDFYVKRAGEAEPVKLTLYPVHTGLAPRVGIFSAVTTELALTPVSPTAPLGGKDSPLKAGDIVKAVAGIPVESSADIQKVLATHIGATTLTVERTHKPEKEGEKPTSEELTIDLPARPMLRLGLVMTPGPISAVQQGSPAAEAELKPGDELLSIGEEPLGDPLTLNNRLLARVGEQVTLKLQRDGKEMEKSVTLRAPDTANYPAAEDEPVPVPTIGVTLPLTNHVAEVIADSPAAKEGVKAGDEVTKAVVGEQKLTIGDKERTVQPQTVEFDDEHENWYAFVDSLQSIVPDTTITLTLKGGRSVKLTAAPTDEPNPERGLIFKPLLVERRAKSNAEALRFAATETVEGVALVIGFLRNIGTQISPKAMSGPWGILQAGYSQANSGLSDFLIFLGMLSANLAVLNFLPIPLLDGGHMLFLILEGIRGKPVNERIVLAFHYIGFLFLISVMAFVFALDLHIIPRTP